MESTQHSDPSQKALQLVDLPLEIFQRIVRESIQARTLSRGLRLRLVNRLFAIQVLDVLFLYNLLDATLSIQEKKLPPFAASYLESRVLKEPENGNPCLVCIRQVAQHLTTDPQATQQYISSLCTLAAPNVARVFAYHKPPWEPLSQGSFEKHVHVAAVYMNHVQEIDTMGTPTTPSLLFGSCLRLVGAYGTKDMLDQYLKKFGISGRGSALHHAARRGRKELVSFIFNYQIENHPWKFDREMSSSYEFLVLEKALRTPEPEIWDYITARHLQYDIPIPDSTQTAVLITCAQEGWTDMAKHLLAGGADPNATDHSKQSPLLYAAQDGHTGVARILLDCGAKVQKRDVKVAASNGHLETTRLLISHEPEITGCLVAAARGGYGEIVKLLLDHGADANECGDLPAIGFAVITEHTAMFRCLVERGARPPTTSMRKTIEDSAAKVGVQSALALLDSWDIETQT